MSILKDLDKIEGRKNRIIEGNRIIYKKLAEEDPILASQYWNYVLVPTQNLIDTEEVFKKWVM